MVSQTVSQVPWTDQSKVRATKKTFGNFVGWIMERILSCLIYIYIYILYQVVNDCVSSLNYEDMHTLVGYLLHSKLCPNMWNRSFQYVQFMWAIAFQEPWVWFGLVWGRNFPYRPGDIGIYTTYLREDCCVLQQPWLRYLTRRFDWIHHGVVRPSNNVHRLVS
jgi:hypothetical protein